MSRSGCGDEIWVMSRPAYDKMTYQKDGIEEIGTIKGTELIGLKCTGAHDCTGRYWRCLPTSATRTSALAW